MADATKTEALANSNGVQPDLHGDQSNLHSPPSWSGEVVPCALSPAGRMTLEAQRRPAKKSMVWNLSKTSWLFLILALIQVFLISALQIAIVAVGEFRTAKGLSQYDICLDPDLQQAIRCAKEANQTVSIPSFGRDKEIYIYLFLFLTVYNFFLCTYALKTQNFIELIAFVCINLLTMGYAAVQVWQFRGYGGGCPLITNIGYLALASVVALFIFTVLFIVLSVFLYVEFGWKIYKYVDCNSELIHCYRIYKIFLSSVKILILFTVVFSIAQVVLLLYPTDYEFALTIVLAVASILAHGVVYIIVRREWRAGYILLLSVGAVLVPAYYIFKVQRFATKECPTCIVRDLQLQMERMSIKNALNNINNTGIPACINKTMLNDSSFPEDRSSQLQNLVIVASVNLATSVVVVCVFIALWMQRGKGLKEHFKAESTCLWLGEFYNSHVKEESEGGGAVKIFQLHIKGRRKKSTYRHSSSLQEYDRPTRGSVKSAGDSRV